MCDCHVNGPSLLLQDNDAVSPASSREGSITPTNEPPPMEVPLEEPMTPKVGRPG